MPWTRKRHRLPFSYHITAFVTLRTMSAVFVDRLCPVSILVMMFHVIDSAFATTQKTDLSFYTLSFLENLVQIWQSKNGTTTTGTHCLRSTFLRLKDNGMNPFGSHSYDAETSQFLQTPRNETLVSRLNP